MSVSGVKKAIAQAKQDPVGRPAISRDEARAIVAAAESDKKVSKTEADPIGKLMPATGSAFGDFQGNARNTPAVKVNAGAAEVFNAFFSRHNLPMGGNASAMKSKMDAALQTLDTSAPLAHPPSTRGMHQVLLADGRPHDGNLQEAFVDATKGEFFLKSTPARMRPGVEPSWFGPLKLDASAVTTPGTPATSAAISSQLTAATAGMLFTSESDYPFTPLLNVGEGRTGGVTPARFLELQGLPANTVVDVRNFEQFMTRLATPYAGMEPEQIADCQRYAALKTLMEGSLKDLQVIRTGEIEIGVHIMGRSPAGDLVGLSTTSIET